MRIPEFSPENPEICFLIMESKAAWIVADSTKYAHVVSSLGSRYIAKIRDIILDPPAERAYDFIKSELIKPPARGQDAIVTRARGDRKFLRYL